MDKLELDFKVIGLVQGIGYRWLAKQLAKKLNLSGYCGNFGNNGFECIVQGSKEEIEDFLKEIKKGPDKAQIENISFSFNKPVSFYEDFKIL